MKGAWNRRRKRRRRRRRRSRKLQTLCEASELSFKTIEAKTTYRCQVLAILSIRLELRAIGHKAVLKMITMIEIHLSTPA